MTPRHLPILTLLIAALATACAAESPRQSPRSPLLNRIPAPIIPRDAANPVTADVNGDKRDDLLIAAGKTLLVLISRGDGTFAPPREPPVALPMETSESLAADFNADGHADLALANHDSYDVVILLGDGRGNFAAPAGSPFSSKPTGKSPHTHGLAAGEFNRDGKIDLVVGHQNDNDLSLLLGDGHGKFTAAPRSFPCGPAPYPIATADFDADGNSDVIVPNAAPGANTVTILMGAGDATLVPARNSPIKIPGGAFFATAGDINHDNKPDAVVTHTEGDDRATILVNDGQGRLTPSRSSPLTIGDGAWGVAIADMNQDTHPDLAFAADDAIRIFLGSDARNAAAGRFLPAPGSPFPTPKGAWRLALADFNADGKPDLVARCVDAKELVVMMGQ